MNAGPSFMPRTEETCFQMLWSQETKPRGFKKMSENRGCQASTCPGGSGDKLAEGLLQATRLGLTGQARDGRMGNGANAEKHDCRSTTSGASGPWSAHGVVLTL